MADEKLKKFRYAGPPVYLPAIDQVVEDGDEVKGPANLAFNAGFTEVGKSRTKGGDG